MLLNKNTNACPIYPTQRGSVKIGNHQSVDIITLMKPASQEGHGLADMLCLLISHLKSATLFLLWALNNKDEGSQNAADPSVKMNREDFFLFTSSFAPLSFGGIFLYPLNAEGTLCDVSWLH